MATGGYILANSSTNTGSITCIGSMYTPVVTLVGGAGNTVPVYVGNSGTYVQIGPLVHVNIYLAGDGGAEGAGTGTFTVSLPVVGAPSNEPGGYFPAGYLANGTSESPLWAQFTNGGSQVDLAHEDVLNNFVVITGSGQDSTTRSVRLKFSYYS